MELIPLTPELTWMAIPAIMIAGLVHGTFGIGFPMVATPLLALFTDVLTAVLITILPTISVNVSIITRGGLKQLSAIKHHLWILPFSLLGTLIGSMLLLWLDPRPFLLLLALAILLYLNQARLTKLDFGWVRQHNGLAYVLFGLTAGIMAGTVNVMLPVLIILSLELRIVPAAMVVLFNSNFLTGKLTQTGFFLQQQLEGFVPFLLSTLWLVPVALLCLTIGFWINKRITDDIYLKILRGVLWLISGVLIVRFVFSYM